MNNKLKKNEKSEIKEKWKRYNKINENNKFSLPEINKTTEPSKKISTSKKDLKVQNK